MEAIGFQIVCWQFKDYWETISQAYARWINEDVGIKMVILNFTISLTDITRLI